MDNVLDNSAQNNLGDGTVCTAASQNPAGTMLPFNPFTETPVRGVNYERGRCSGSRSRLPTTRPLGATRLIDVPFLFNPGMSLVFSALIGVVFGYFTARAAPLDPIEALRYE